MKRLLLLPCLALTMWGFDLSGKWSGIIEVTDPSSGTSVNTPVRAVFEQKDHVVSGKIGRRSDTETEAIQNGNVEGNTIRFEVTSPETTGAMHFNLKLVDNDRLEGDMKGAIETGGISGKVKLTKLK
jgi:hypothetical protein